MGIRSTNLPAQYAIDELIANVTDEGVMKTARVPIAALASQLAGTGAFIFGNMVYVQTRAQLLAIAPDTETVGGVVLNDSTAAYNGYYSRVAAAWVRQRGFPDTFAKLTQSGGTNAVVAATDVGVDPATIEIFHIEPTAGNSGNVTLAVNGGAAKPVRNVNGDELAAGEWTSGRKIMLVEDVTDYRLLSDPDADGAAASAAASAAAAENDRELAEIARGAAEAAAAGVTIGLAKARVVTTTNTNLAAPGASLDGVAMAVGQAFLAAGQTSVPANGLYVWNGAAVAATRHPVYLTYDSVAGQYFSILEGTVNGDTLWRCTSNLGGTIGVTDLLIEKYTAALVVRRQVFVANGTYTPHAKMLYAELEGVGGGGAGASTANSGAGTAGGPGGGGAGEYAKRIVTRADIGASKAVTIGAGGAPAAAGANPGGNGGDTSVGTLLVANGGDGAPAGFAGLGGDGGNSGTGDVTVPGTKGGGGGLQTIITVNVPAGVGASSVYGGSPGPRYFNATTAGAAATGYGAGGNGAVSWNAGGTGVGGAGSPGIVVITEMCSG